MKKARKYRPSPAMIVACLALIVALGGTAIAGGVLNKKKVNKIISNRAPSLDVKSAKNADKAGDTDKLGGVASSSYQRFCEAGGLKGSLVINTNGFTSTTFVNEPGFNCFQPGNTTSSVQMKTPAPGDYVVRFVGNSGPNNTGSAVCSGYNLNIGVGCKSTTDVDAPGEAVFDVRVFNTITGNPTTNQFFSLLAF
jgi:hypothetical protein